MEDLVPFLIFLVIIAINVIKFFANKGKPKKPAQKPGEAPPRRPVSSIEDFFANLAEQIEPKPAEPPEWPEGFERPDYRQEMEEFEPSLAEDREPEQTAEIIPMPKPPPIRAARSEIRDFQRLETPAAVQPPMRATNAILSGSQGMRMPCMNPFNHNAAPGHVDFRIEGKRKLKQAMLAHVVFSPPRAYDLSFDNTIAK